MIEPWPAPCASAPVQATVRLPGSKSQTNRALVLAALARTPSTLVGPLVSRDTSLMAAGLRAMGTAIDESAGSTGRSRRRRCAGPAAVDVGNAGTVMRFLPPVAALADGDVRFDGDPRSHDAAAGAGARAPCATSVPTSTAPHDRLPLTVHGRGWLLGGSVTLDASPSSQFVSALLLAGAALRDALEVRHDGGRLPSGAALDMTVAMLRAAGAIVEHVDDRHLAGRARPGRTLGRLQSSRTCPTRRRSWPPPWSPAAGSRCPTGRAHHPGRRRAARPAAPLRRHGRATTTTG